MNRKTKGIVVAAAVALFCLAGFASAEEAAKGPLQKGQKIPQSFQVTTLQGAAVALKDQMTGERNVLVFVNTACSTCQAELGLLRNEKKKYGDRLNVVAVFVDAQGAARVQAFADAYKYPVLHLLDPGFEIPPHFGMNYTPGTVFVDQKGVILGVFGGFAKSEVDNLKSAIAALF